MPLTSAPPVATPEDFAVSGTYSDANPTTGADIANYNYDAILRDKEGHIYQIYQLADYYVDKDPLIRGIIKEVYTPFSASGKWKLVGTDEKTRKAYMQFYRRIGLEDFMYSCFLQFYKYGNVFPYLMKDGRLRTMPVGNMRIGNVMISGNPIAEFNCGCIRRDFIRNGYMTEKGYIQDDELNIRLAGFPDEIVNGVRKGEEWVQLNPFRCIPMQDLTEDWTRYAYPFITACFTSLQKKELISNYEDATLRLGARGFVHATYGDPDNKIMPDKNQLTSVNKLILNAMQKTSLATTNNWAEVKFVQADMQYLYDNDKYRDVNNDILSAGGISGIIVSGVARDGSTFASAQVSLQTAEKRISHARKKFEMFMNQINESIRLMGLVRADKAPVFQFNPLDLQNNSRFQETCLKLWEKGAVSTRTALELTGFDFGQEIERINEEQKIKKEVPIGVNETNDKGRSNSGESTNEVGRPEMDDSQTDKSKSLSGKLPKPSNPNGSI